MDKIAFFLKTYRRDLQMVNNLISSYLQYNSDGIKLFISVPECDFPLFQSVCSADNITLLRDDAITTELAQEAFSGFSLGYINQQIIKLAFWEKRFCENYFVLDSDGYFIREFKIADFIHSSGYPYTVLVQDKDLSVEPLYQDYWKERKARISQIARYLDIENERFVTSHGFTILSSKVLASMVDKIMAPNGIRYVDLIRMSPFEFSWYNHWLLKDKPINIIPIEPLFKVFHFEEQYERSRKSGIRERDLAQAYLGICMNSNWFLRKTPRYRDPVFNFARLKLFLRKIWRS